MPSPVDSAEKARPVLYNTLVAVRDVVNPFEAIAKRQESIKGLDGLVEGLGANIGVDVSVLAVVPIGYKNTRDQRESLGVLKESGFEVPVAIGEQGLMMEGCWKQQCTPDTYVEKHRNQKRDYEIETLEQSTT